MELALKGPSESAERPQASPLIFVLKERLIGSLEINLHKKHPLAKVDPVSRVDIFCSGYR